LRGVWSRRRTATTFVSLLSVRRTEMKSGFRIAVLLCLAGLLLAACNLPRVETTPGGDALATMVQQTMNAIESLTPAAERTPLATPPPLATSTPNTGEVSGQICYRNSTMSQLTLYFTNTSTGVVTEIPVSRPQTEYRILLEPGIYTVYGWPPDYSIGVLHEGGAFQVVAGQETTGIDVCDWSHGPFDVPYPPGYTPLTGSGSISGGIYGYPYGALPTMYVVARNQDTGYWYWVGTAPGVAWYSFDELPAGHYQVVAYDISGNAGGCPNIVLVSGGSAATCDCNDWSGGYPPKPSGGGMP
jgi:hypothetical protein